MTRHRSLQPVPSDAIPPHRGLRFGAGASCPCSQSLVRLELGSSCGGT